jgi:antitoxin component YwqK of YwqJK toxin-antitoxin module
MIRIVIVVFTLCCTVLHTSGQTLIPFEFISEEENRFLKENDSVRFYVSLGDTSNVVCLNEEASYYKLLDKNRKVIAEGSYVTEGDKFLQTGKWVERYSNGKLKNTGYYLRDKPSGTWQEYYENGKLKTIANYTIIGSSHGSSSYCLSGSWQEFYQDGKLKVNGYYSANETKVKDTLIVEDPITEQKVSKVTTRAVYTPARSGTWEYYSESGELDKKEEF